MPKKKPKTVVLGKVLENPKLKSKEQKEPVLRIAEALESISEELSSLHFKIEEGFDGMQQISRSLWDLEKAVRGEPREEG